MPETSQSSQATAIILPFSPFSTNVYAFTELEILGIIIFAFVLDGTASHFGTARPALTK